MSFPSVRRVLRGLLTLVVVVAGLALLPAAPASAADRNFSVRFSTNDTGDIDMFGNTVLTCPDGASGCTAARTAGTTTTANSALNNNAYAMQYVDVDSDPSTFNSSSRAVSIPAGASVLFAGLYRGGRVTAGTNPAGAAAPNAAAKNTVRLRTPGSAAYTTITASVVDEGSNELTRASPTSPRWCGPPATAPTPSATSRPAPVESAATADGSGWTGRIENRTTGQAQGKVIAVCLSRATVSGPDPQYDVIVSAPVSSRQTWAAGPQSVGLFCGAGKVAVAPSWQFTSGYGTVRSSERVDDGWYLDVDVPEAAQLVFSIRCLSTSLATAGGHTHQLGLQQLGRTITVPAGQTGTSS